MLRLSLVSASAIAFFWAVWYLATGSVPVVESIEMSGTMPLAIENKEPTRVVRPWILELPFRMSRLWDILIGPIWSCLLVRIFANEKIVEVAENEKIAGLVETFPLVLGFELAFGLVLGLLVLVGVVGSDVLFWGPIVAFVLGFLVNELISGPVSWQGVEPIVELVFGLSYVLTFILSFALVYGLAFGLLVGVLVVLDELLILLLFVLGLGLYFGILLFLDLFK